ncbi:hypothetical protein AZL_a08030 (plasmid) [Azospirillum sp. B510]|uniref:hypothetical protein n=1 Tax=Azospirillum sp. (strain B510) TaxID=137722 RepID=UPI0001C4BB08|nr:hypothetical protein [Azospirillum sp. B510]BAI74334.1 hypothetical protein AZL_a08030 [Azospirillum sp. B510]
MSKAIMWAEADARGFETECLFNEDNRSYEVLVSAKGLGAKGLGIGRAESFPVVEDPGLGMSPADLHQSIKLADRLVWEMERSLGDL